MNALMTDEDTPARELIKSDIDTNFFVEAGAGSGKTTGLVARMIAMVRAGREVDKICAITYTKAAAKEFYGRFQKKLTEVIKDEKDPVMRERCRQALSNIDLCFMGTIDSFCHTIVSEHPNEAGVPASSAVISEEDFSARCRREYAAILSGEYGDDLKKKADLFAVCIPAYQRDAVFRLLLGMLAGHRNADIIYDKPKGSPDATYKPQADALRQLCAVITDPNTKLNASKGNDGVLESIKRNRTSVKGRVSDNFDTFIKLSKDLQKATFAQMPAVPVNIADLFGEYKNGWRMNEDAMQAFFGDMSEEKYRAAMDFVWSAVQAITEKLREKGELRFYDYLLYLRDMLKADAEKDGRLINYITGKHRYFLVDEFQDTDPLQSEIVFYLAAKKPCGDWTKCVPREGSLFIVGDPKQSIYSFKGADIEQFLRVRELFEKGAGKVLRLTKNFRSSPELCRKFNHTFAALMPEDTAVNSKFSEIPVEDGAADKGLTGTYFYKAYESKGDPRYATMNDRLQTVNIINSLVGDPRRKISRKKKDGSIYLDEIRYSDIMVIVRSKAAVGEALKVLSENNIPAMAEGRISFENCPLLDNLATAAEALARPDDAEAVFSVLTGPVFGISVNELIKLRNDGLRLSLYCKEEELAGHPNISKAVKELMGVYRKIQGLSPAAAMDFTAAELELWEKSGAADLEYYCFAMELLRQAECCGEVMTYRDGAELLRRLLAGSLSEERCISLQKGSDRVRLANLHKVKGLEAPVVILASPGGKIFAPESSTKATASGEEFRVLEVSESNGTNNTIYVKTDSCPNEKDKAADKLAAEHLRLLYVAATRAEKLLIVSQWYTETKKDPDALRDTVYWSDIADIFGKDDNFFTKFGIPADDRAAKPRAEADIAKLRAEAECTDLEAKDVREPSYSLKRPSDLEDEKTAMPVNAGEVPDDTEARAEGEEAEITEKAEALGIPANVIGTMVHRLMEVLVSSKGRAERDGTVEEIINDYWHEDEAVSAKLKEVYDTMTGGGYRQENGSEADLLGLLADAECHCEFPFCTYDGDRLVNGIMDLVYQKGGKWYIVDYKTNTEGKGLDEKYASQLSAYRKALKEVLGVEAESRIYHIAVR